MIKKWSSKFNHFKSENQISSENSIISRYFYFNPDFDRVHEILRNNVNIYNKNYNQYAACCLLKLKTDINIKKIISITIKTNSHYSYFLPEKIILKRSIKKGDTFSQILEMRISFISSRRFMTYQHYLKQKLPMFENKLNQILHRGPILVNQFNRFLPHPSINHYDHIPNKI